MTRRFEIAAFIVLGTVAGLAPIILALTLAWRAANTSVTESAGHHAARVLAEATNVLTEADMALRAILFQHFTGCDKAAHDFLILEAYRSETIREFGLYDRNGGLICTNFGPGQGSIGGRGDELWTRDGYLTMGLKDTRVVQERSLIVLRDAPHGGGAYAAIDPGLFLRGVDPGEWFPDSKVELRLSDDQILAQAGAELVPDALVAQTRSAHFPIMASVYVPQAAVFARWGELALPVGGAGLAASIILVALVLLIAHRRFSFRRDVERGLRRGEFVPWYQPVVDGSTGRVVGCEALVRWVRADGSVMRPDLFIPIVEETGQIIPITDALIRHIRADLTETCRDHPRFRVAINLIADHFQDPGLARHLSFMFSEDTIAPRQVALEITERRPIPDMDRAVDIIRGLQAAGFKVELDDAGTGHGGLAYLQKLGMDALKIDRMFVAAVGTDQATAPVVEALVHLGACLKMEVIAEGVETEAQRAALSAYGIRLMQGFLFAPPMPRDEFLAYMARTNAAAEQAAVQAAC